MLDPTLKWKASEEKVRFARSFPGMVDGENETSRPNIRETQEINGRTITIFSDGSFSITPLNIASASDLMQALRQTRPLLEPRYPDAYKTLDMLILRDEDLARQGRKEKLLSSIAKHHLEIPSLSKHVARCLAYPDTPPTPEQFVGEPTMVYQILKAIHANLSTYPELLDEIPLLLKDPSYLLNCDKP